VHKRILVGHSGGGCGSVAILVLGRGLVVSTMLSHRVLSLPSNRAHVRDSE
jgi:hypothetical protein